MLQVNTSDIFISRKSNISNAYNQLNKFFVISHKD